MADMNRIASSVGYRVRLFFFQAEDGIRDYKVTGVQTCALPISASSPIPLSRRRRRTARNSSPATAPPPAADIYIANQGGSPLVHRCRDYCLSVDSRYGDCLR